VFCCARFINFPISLDGTITSRKPILEWFDGLRRDAGFVLRSIFGNDRVLKWKKHIYKFKSRDTDASYTRTAASDNVNVFTAVTIVTTIITD
jgi:hypothetical protein